MTESTPSETRVGYVLAMNDMVDVAQVARMLADHDPDLRFSRRIADVGVEQAAAEEDVLRRTGRYQLLGDFHLRMVVETGLIVTYARPFTRGDGSGLPIEEEQFVPPNHRDFHRELLILRNRVFGHIDAAAPAPFRREVSVSDSSNETQGPARLSQSQYATLASLAWAIRDRLREVAYGPGDTTRSPSS